MHRDSSLKMTVARLRLSSSAQDTPYKESTSFDRLSSPSISSSLAIRKQDFGQISTQPPQRMHFVRSKMVKIWHWRHLTASLTATSLEKPNSTSLSTDFLSGTGM